MARITARHAYAKTRSKTKRLEKVKTMIDARRRYVQQLNQVGIQVEGGSQNEQNLQAAGPSNQPQGIGPILRNKSRRKPLVPIHTKKITDYFSKATSLDFSPKAKQPLRTSSSFDPNGVECVTILDSDNESLDGNNNSSDGPGNPVGQLPKVSLGSVSSSFWDSSSDSGNSSSSPSRLQLIKDDIKPCVFKLDISNLGVSFEELNVKFRVDEDVEIVDMLPPIPLRKHEVFDLDDEEGEENGSIRSPK